MIEVLTLRAMTEEEARTLRALAHSRTTEARLRDRRRDGRPTTYAPAQVGALIAASLTDPQALGLPFASWTLDRLATYLHETQGIAMQRSRIGEILQREGLRWRKQETWFGERPDPAFAEKRGPSSASPPHPPRTAS